MEAGNRCFDQRVPEEINRVIVDHIADMNLTYSDIAREMLLREGLPPDRVVKTGSPMFEILTHFAPQIAASDVLQRLDLSEGGFYVFTDHREDNICLARNFPRLPEVIDCPAERHAWPD